MADKQDVFRPGEFAPFSGVYDVVHDQIDGQDHAEIHQIDAIKGEMFLPCKACKEGVSYRFVSHSFNDLIETAKG